MSEHLSSPIPTRARRDLAKATADRLTKTYSMPPIPIIELAEEHGVQVILADFGEYREKVAGFCDFHASKLFVNKDDISVRRMFTIAHELGHWMLHRNIFEQHPETYPILPRFQKGDSGNALEQEANAFAANLLVPSRLLTPVLGSPVSALASIFQVSKTMMENRLKNV
jgi:Zn-dependent peptidase ImmA (M78 family)